MLYVDGLKVVDDDGQHDVDVQAGAVNLQAGVHKLRLEYYQAGGPYGLALSWAGPGIISGEIPVSQLSHSL